MSHMPTNLNIDDALLAEAQRLGGFRTKRETVEAALADYVQHQNQLGMLKLRGKIDFDPTYDYKAGRNRQ